MTTTTLRDDVRTRLYDRLTARLGAAKVRLWLDAGTTLDYLADDDTLRVAAPSRFVADRLRRAGLTEALREAGADVLGHDVAVHVVVTPQAAPGAPHGVRHPTRTSSDEGPATQTGSDDQKPPRRPPTAKGNPDAGGFGDRFAQLRGENPTAAPMRPQRRGGHPYADTGLRHRLEDFVTGTCNELAHAAARRLAEADPADASVCSVPLFVHGGCGLGKTHLLQGICRRWVQRRAGTRVLYTTGEQFTNRYIDHAQRGALDAFRKAMRSVDLLAVDDVHFIAGKAKTQTEFLHCFDAIELCGAPVVLASDQHPRQIKQFTEALASRCLRGLVVEVTAPDTATRRELLNNLGARRHLVFQPAALDALAREAGPSVREIEGLLIQLHALATLTSTGGAGAGVTVGMALVDRLLAHQRAQCPPKPATVPAIVRVVAERFALPPRQVLGNGRQRAVVLARSVVAHLARQLTPMSYPEIAAAMNRPNHSSVITADKRVQQLLRDDAAVPLPTRDEPVRLADLLDDLKHAVRKAE